MGTSLPLLPALPQVEPPFIVLAIPRSQTASDRSRPHGERYVFAPGRNADTAKLRIGRTRECELRISDVTVSREHAGVTYENGQFILRDNGAKFKTLLLPRGPEPISSQKMSVQAGRTLLSFSMFPEEQ